MARKTSVPIPTAPLVPGYLLRFVDLRPHVRLSRQTVLTLENAGRFPRAVRFGPRCTLWRSADVIAWLDSPEHYRASWLEEGGESPRAAATESWPSATRCFQCPYGINQYR
ncbi:helix-turn-helix transcriptional regulator [Paraburkholderia sp. BR10882]|uniref:helix-turn-helix transcriptional regulator n=1 Tax=unclassified Paraburkholderia TaxID=2615204 RepID=UPI0034CEFBE8